MFHPGLFSNRCSGNPAANDGGGHFRELKNRPPTGDNAMNERTRPTGNSTPREGSEKAKPRKGRLGAEIQRKIGHQLRSMYIDVVNEGVPDRFAELIKRLDSKDRN
jgi:hypothetical protein